MSGGKQTSRRGEEIKRVTKTIGGEETMTRRLTGWLVDGLDGPVANSCEDLWVGELLGAPLLGRGGWRPGAKTIS